MESFEDLQEPDEARSAKRARLEAPLAITEDVQEEVFDDDGWDDIYEAPADAVDGAENASAAEAVAISEEDDARIAGAGLPGANVELPTNGERSEGDVSRQDAPDEKMYDQAAATNGLGDDGGLVAQQNISTTNRPSAMVLEETTTVSTEPSAHIVPAAQSILAGDEASGSGRRSTADGDTEELATEGAGQGVLTQISKEDQSQLVTQPHGDLEAPATAQLQQENENAETQFDSSDADSNSSSDSDSDSGSEDSGSEDGYEMLDPATAAKLLMRGDGEDDEDGKGKDKGGGDRQPRTANEVKETIVPKPNIVVTENMGITLLGVVDRVVDNQLLIKGISAERQALESGSVLCTEDRGIVGAVADTFGRVTEPMYSVAFTNAQEIEDAGYMHGTKIYYVDSHSRFVFTQDLKQMKGTDASNIHDEEIGEDELEFSDDEVEAEFKRRRKLAKRGGAAPPSRTSFIKERNEREFNAPASHDVYPSRGNDAPQEQYNGGLPWDENDAADDTYIKIPRPDNLHDLMAQGGPPRPSPGQFDRGRGRGRGDRGRGRGDRGRGDRGRGRGGFENRNQRGGRGGGGQDRNPRGQLNGNRDAAHSFPDRHNDRRPDSAGSQVTLPNYPMQKSASPPQKHLQHQQQQQQYPPYQPPTAAAGNPQMYQFNGYTFQYGNQAPPPQSGYQQQQPQSPAQPFPAGAYVNPNFFPQQQQWTQSQMQAPPQQQQPPSSNYGGWSQQQQQQAYQQPQQQYGQPLQQAQQPQGDDLARILRQFGPGRG